MSTRRAILTCLGFHHPQPLGAGSFDQRLEPGCAISEPVELCLGDLIVLGVAGLDVGLLQQLERGPVALGGSGPRLDQSLILILG